VLVSQVGDVGVRGFEVLEAFQRGGAAGVGALFADVIAARTTELHDQAAALPADCGPAQAFFAFWALAVEQANRNAALCGALAPGTAAKLRIPETLGPPGTAMPPAGPSPPWTQAPASQIIAAPGREPRAVPTFTTSRSTGEVASSDPAASPPLRRSPEPRERPGLLLHQVRSARVSSRASVGHMVTA